MDSSESELGILDLIQVFVETLDKCFENVCELDLIFHMDKVHYILNELVMGGMVLETNMTEILTRVEEQNKIEKEEVSFKEIFYKRWKTFTLFFGKTGTKLIFDRKQRSKVLKDALLLFLLFLLLALWKNVCKEWHIMVLELPCVAFCGPVWPYVVLLLWSSVALYGIL